MSTELADLMERLRSSDAQQRLQAADALSTLGEDAAPAAVALLEAIGDPEEQVREFVVAALEGMGVPPSALAGDVSEHLDSANADTAYWAATLLGRVGENAPATVPALARTLSDGDTAPQVKQRCAWALGKMGASARESLPALEKASQSEDTRLARLATSAMAAIQDAGDA